MAAGLFSHQLVGAGAFTRAAFGSFFTMDSLGREPTAAGGTDDGLGCDPTAATAQSASSALVSSVICVSSAIMLVAGRAVLPVLAASIDSTQMLEYSR
jgi:hypothetical protein